jgi:hypothetical protein
VLRHLSIGIKMTVGDMIMSSSSLLMDIKKIESS